MDSCQKGHEKLSLLEEDVQFLHNEVEAQVLLFSDDVLFEPLSSVASSNDLSDIIACSCSQLLCHTFASRAYDSLTGLVHCLPYHLGCAAEYQQFFHGLKHTSAELSAWMKWLERMHARSHTSSVSDIVATMTMATAGLVKLQDKINVLTSTAHSVIPLRYRKETAARPLRVRSLTSYEGADGFRVSEREECTLLDNSDSMAWMVQTSSGAQAKVPPVIMALYPPSPEAVDGARRLKYQMLSLWVSALRIFRARCIKLLTARIASEEIIDQCSTLTRNQRNNVLLRLRELARSSLAAYTASAPADGDGHVIASADNEQLVSAFKLLYSAILSLPADVHTDGDALPSEDNSSTDGAIISLDELGKLCRRLEDMKDYAEHYDAVICSSASTNTVWVNEGRKYVSSAYIKRVKNVEINPDTSAAPGKETVLYICEKAPAVIQSPTHLPDIRDNAEAAIRLPQDIAKENTAPLLHQEPSGGSSSSSWLKQRGQLIRQKSSVDEHPSDDSVFVVLEVMNTRSGKYVSPSVALRRGLVNADMGKFFDVASGTHMPLEDAVNRGFVKVEAVNTATNGFHNENGGAIVIAKSRPAVMASSYDVQSVEDPRTLARVSMQYALAAGIVDVSAGAFRNPETNEVISLEEALDRGKIFASPCPSEPVLLTSSTPSSASSRPGSVLKVYNARRKSAKFVFTGVDMQDPNNIAYKALSECMDVGVRGVVDSSGRTLSVREAYSQKLLKFDTLTYELPDGTSLPLEEAAIRGLVKMAAAQALLGACRKLSLGALVDNGALDAAKGLLVTDSSSSVKGLQEALESAIDSGALEPYAIFCRTDGRLLSLGHAMKERKLHDGGCDSGDGLVASDSASCLLTAGAVEPHVGSLSRALREAFVLEKLSAVIDFGAATVRGLSEDCKQPLALDEAVRAGTFDLEHAAVVDCETGRSLDLHEAVHAGLVEASAARDIYRALDALSLQRALFNNVTMANGDSCFDDRADGENETSVRAAVGDGLLTSEGVFLVDAFTSPGCARICSLSSLRDEGLFDASNCAFISDGESVPMQQAIEAGLVRPAIKYWDFLDGEPVTLAELLSTRSATEKSRLMIENGVSIPVREALANKVVAQGTLLHYDCETTNLSLIEHDSQLLLPLVQMPDMVDWLSDIELQLAEQRQPCETCAGLVGQVELLEGLQANLEQRKPQVNELADASSRVLEERKNSEKSEFTQQQHQQLKTLSSDMKATHDKTNRQLRHQIKQLRSMKGFLEEFCEKRDSFDDWSHEAQRKLDRADSGPADLDAIEEAANQQKQVQEEITQMETKLMGMQTTGLKFMAEAKEYEKVMDAFRQTVHKPLRRPSAVAATSLLPNIVQTTTDVASEKLRVVRSRSSATRERVHLLGQKAKRYCELEQSLSAWLPLAEARTASLNLDTNGATNGTENGLTHVDIDSVRSCLAAVGAVVADATSQRSACASLRTAADDLLGCLAELPMGSAVAVTVSSTVGDREARYATLVDALLARQRHLDGILLDAQDVDKAVDGVASLLEDAARRLAADAAASSLSLDRSVVGSQLSALHELEASAGIASAQAEQLELRLPTISQHNPDDEQGRRLEAAVVAVAAARSAAASRATELGAFASRLDALTASCGSLQRWVIDVVADLQLSAAANPAAVRTHCEEQYEAKRCRQPELDAFKAEVQALVDEPRSTHRHCLLDMQADLCSKWRDLSELLIDLNVMQALRDVEEQLGYFAKYETALTKACFLPADAHKLQAQYREHQASHENLESKKVTCLDAIQKCMQMLRETTRDDDNGASLRLSDARQFITNTWKMSGERLRSFDELLPLVQHFTDTRARLRSWLADISSELSTASAPCSSMEDIKKQQETIKVSARSIDDQKPLVEDFVNTAREVATLVAPATEAAAVQSAAAEVAAQFDTVRATAYNRLADLAALLHSATSEVAEALEVMLDELVQVQIVVENAEGIAATVDKISEQIEENRGLTEDADRRQLAIAGIKLSADKLLAQVREQEENEFFDEDKPHIDAEDIEFKISEMETLNETIQQKTEQRGRSLVEALGAAKDFWSLYNDLMRAFYGIQDSIRAQDPPQSDVSLIQEQEKEQKEIKEALRTAIPKLEVIRKMSENLAPLVGESGKVEIHRSIEEVDDTFEDIGDRMSERQANLREAMENASRLEEEIEGVLSWLPKFEGKMETMSTGSLDIRSLRIQIEEVKILKLQLGGKCIAVEAVKNQVAALSARSNGGAEESALSAVADIVARWNTLKTLISEKEQELQDNLIRLGEVDTALEEMNGYLQQVEDDLLQLGKVYGDPKYIETHLKKVKMFEDDLLCQEPILSTLNQTIAHIASRNQSEVLRSSPLLSKQGEMNSLFNSVSTLIRDNRNKLNDKLTTVKSYLGEVDDLVNWFVDFEETLKAVKTIGALPETAQKQCEKFNDHLAMLNSRSDAAHRLLMAGDEVMTSFSCHPFHTVQMRSALSRLKRSCESAKKQAKKKKQKLQEHLQNVTGFHSVMKVFADWLASSEQSLGKFKNPSKIVETIELQLKLHKDFQDDVEAHREIVERLDRTGTYLKYYGAKNDAVVIRNQLIAIKLRWKRLLWKTDERGRLLQRCRREDKRFAVDWKNLVQWLTQSKDALDHALEHNPSSSRAKDLIEEIKRLELQMSRKYPHFFSTIRLGRSMKDRCTKTDPEREILGSMVDELKSKWTILKTEFSRRQTQLDERLLESGRLQEATKSLVEWLAKAEELLKVDNPLLGDLDTVGMLMEQHKAFQEELQGRSAVLNTLQQACSPQDSAAVAQLQQIQTRFERVQVLCATRDSRLQDSLALATEFQGAVNQLRDFLPQAENELKHQPLPDAAAAVLALVEAHDRFEEQLERVVPIVDRIKVVGEEIASQCHPNAVRFVKYYLTITSTRWEQLLDRSHARRKKLQEALETIESNMALLEELIAWLSDAEVLLFTKEEDEIPDNLALVEDLLKEHTDFHDELTEKGKEVEKFTSLQLEQSRPHTPKGKSSQSLENGNASLATLSGKWRSVWKMSLDRKKRLQEDLERLTELESVRNFDFEIWRKRYLEWIKLKKLRITDFFRQQERNQDGTMCKDEFVTGMLNSKFPTNRAELNAVFSHFDKERTGKINYKEFIDALRPASKKPAMPLTEAEKIHDEIEREVALCKCRTQFKCEKVDEGKYRFGEAQKMVLVRFLNSTVMVRVGGGWVTLEKFLETHDPCKAKGRTNTELREQFSASVEAGQSRAGFAPRRLAATPTRGLSTAAGPSSSDTGYSSGSSTSTAPRHPLLGSTECLSPGVAASASSGASTPGRRSLSALHRSKMLPAALSMVNLASSELPPPGHDYYGRYGSGGSLSRSGAKTPTSLRPSSTTPSSKSRKPGTPTPRSVSQTPPPSST